MADRPLTKHGHHHAEAFCLMWYACDGETKHERVGESAHYQRVLVKSPCGHRELYWNSRDGVTPFGTSCPSCGGSLLHTDFHLDRYAPDHKPHHGQRVWISMTRQRAEQIARERVAAALEHGHEITADRLPSLIDSIHHDGHAPDCQVWGYAEAQP